MTQLLGAKLARFPARMVLAAIMPALVTVVAFGQDKPRLVIEDDCQQFAVGPEGRIAYSVPHIKRVKKTLTERDDVWVVSSDGRKRRIVDGEKFMPQLPPSSYIVDALRWAPDGRHLALDITTQTASSDDDSSPPGGLKAVLLLDDNGQEIKVAGSEKRFIENAFAGTWLADGATVVYLTGVGPYQIQRVSVSGGNPKTLFEGHTFDSVVWDAKRNQAFAVGKNLSLFGREVIVDLNLLKETVSEVARVAGFQGQMTVSETGNKIGYFEDGDTVDIVDINHPQKPARVRMGFGRFEFSRDEKRVLLKRGPVDKSGILVWVGIADGSFQPILHDLTFHDFRIMPGGQELVVSDPGRRILKVFALQ